MNIRDILDVRKAEGDVGIEIECEGKGMQIIGTQYWKTEADGSLRGQFPESCAEFILHKPIAIDKVKDAMADFHAHLPEAKFAFSFRTSTHVHVNVQELEYDQLLAFMYVYLLLEEPLMQYCGQSRIGNRFCLRLADAEGLGDMLHTMFVSGEKALRMIPRDVYRYAAMNIDALSKYGSLEFRGMRGTANADIVDTWTHALYNIREFARKLGTPTEVLAYFTSFGAMKFFKKALGDQAEAFLQADTVANIQRNFSLTLDLPYAYQTKDVVPVAAKKVAKKYEYDPYEAEEFQ